MCVSRIHVDSSTSVHAQFSSQPFIARRCCRPRKQPNNPCIKSIIATTSAISSPANTESTSLNTYQTEHATDNLSPYIIQPLDSATSTSVQSISTQSQSSFNSRFTSTSALVRPLDTSDLPSDTNTQPALKRVRIDPGGASTLGASGMIVESLNSTDKLHGSELIDSSTSTAGTTSAVQNNNGMIVETEAGSGKTSNTNHGNGSNGVINGNGRARSSESTMTPGAFVEKNWFV
ncbi:hypothetical protein BDF19DRAFT_411380 [Syncephalis fuscata]|nr:hypothetical protein BDF19DRAFT_411380 [Syncephalis fuscata]